MAEEDNKILKYYHDEKFMIFYLFILILSLYLKK